MCGRYSLASDPARLRERFAPAAALIDTPRYNIAPGTDVVALTTDREGAPRGELLRWGLVPPWAKDRAISSKMINARAETLTSRAAYRDAFARYRCLIPADGFYEWQARTAARKQPFHITLADGEPFAFAGLWSIWHRGQDDELRTLAIITTVANATLAQIHARMPVILMPDAEAVWLDSATPAAALEQLLHGLEPDRIRLRPVSTAVNDADYDGPDCLADPRNADSIDADTAGPVPAGPLRLFP